MKKEKKTNVFVYLKNFYDHYLEWIVFLVIFKNHFSSQFITSTLKIVLWSRVISTLNKCLNYCLYFYFLFLYTRSTYCSILSFFFFYFLLFYSFSFFSDWLPLCYCWIFPRESFLTTCNTSWPSWRYFFFGQGPKGLPFIEKD